MLDEGIVCGFAACLTGTPRALAHAAKLIRPLLVCKFDRTLQTEPTLGIEATGGGFEGADIIGG